MPLIECACGMMMSVSMREPRKRCIRCGGVEFRFVERGESAQDIDKRLVKRSRPADQARLSYDYSPSDPAAVESNRQGVCP
jgi:predicted  nucleic acid-binding Zn-ribbon protein